MLFSRNQVVLAKIETVRGTDAVPTGADAILCEVVNPTVDGQSITNNVVRASISAEPDKFVNKTVRATIVVRAKGSGEAGVAPEYAPLLKSCALKENVVEDTSVDYTPSNSDSTMKTSTIYIYKDGLLIKAVGCMGNFRFDGRYAEYPSFTFDMEGIFSSASDASNPTPTYDETEPVEMKSEGFKFGTWANAVARDFSFESGNSLVSRGNINAATGLMPYAITARDPRWNSNIEAVLESEHPFWQNFQNSERVALELTHGSVAGNIIEFEAPKATIAAPAFSEESSINMYGVSGQLIEDEGEDNFKITFK